MTYDRTAASSILAALYSVRPFAQVRVPGTLKIDYAVSPLPPGLTLSQRLYLEKFMRPCTPSRLTTATHRVTWRDSQGVPCTGHYLDGGLGPRVPIAVRETVLALWTALDASAAFAVRAAALTASDRAVLAGTTTDHEPREIFRIGVEAAGRTLAQHALVAPRGLSAVEFAAAMRDGGVFAVVAGQWFWELQASTYRRGMVPVAFTGGLPLRYTPESIEVLRLMKDATIAEAHATMAKATTVEGLSEAEAVAKYHDSLDLISRQYALLPAGTRPRCLAQNTIIPGLVEAFVSAFIAIFRQLSVSPSPGDVTVSDGGDSFSVPDMNCKHCQATIRGTLEAMALTVEEVDLVSKRVRVAGFRSPRNRARALDAVRDAGYTVLDGS